MKITKAKVGDTVFLSCANKNDLVVATGDLG